MPCYHNFRKKNYKTTIQDNVKLHEHDWKDHYYQDPFKAKNLEQGGGFQKMCYTYVQGCLCVKTVQTVE